MALEVKHAFESAIPDEPDAGQVKPSDWNALHELTMATGNVLGRTSSGAGVVEEIPLASEAEALAASATDRVMTPERVRQQTRLFHVEVLADLATTTVPADIDRVTVRRYDATSHITDAGYSRVGADPSHDLAGQDAASQWWEIDESIITPAMAGAVYDCDFATFIGTDDTNAFSRAYAVIRAKIVAKERPPELHYGHYGTGFALISGSIDATNLRGSGTVDPKAVFNGIKIEGWGTTLCGEGEGNVTLDLTLCRSVEHEGVVVKGSSVDPPDIGILNSRDDALSASNRNSCTRCSTTGWFRFAARVVFACEIQRDRYCTWWNENDGTDPLLIAASDGKFFAEISIGANLYPTIIKSQYQSTTFTIGDSSGFGGQMREHCDWFTATGTTAGWPLCIGRSEGFNIFPGYIQAVSGNGLLMYVGTNGVYHPKAMHLDLHVEGATDSWLRIERAPGEASAVDLDIIDTQIIEHATQGTHPGGIIDISDAGINSVKWEGGLISIGRFSGGNPAAMFSDPGKVTFNGHATIPLRATFPVATLAGFGGSVFALDDRVLLDKLVHPGYTTINSDATYGIEYGVDGPVIVDTTTVTANRNRAFQNTTGSHVVGSTIRFVRKGSGASPLRLRNESLADLIKDVAQNQWVDVVWNGTAWELVGFGSL